MYLSLLCYMFNIVLSESSDMYEKRIYEFRHTKLSGSGVVIGKFLTDVFLINIIYIYFFILKVHI